MKRTIVLAALALLMFVTAGCETIKGVGKDLSAVGGWLSKGAEHAQNPGSNAE